MDFSLGERGGSLNSALVLDDRLCSSLKLRLLNNPTRFFGFTLTLGTSIYEGTKNAVMWRQRLVNDDVKTLWCNFAVHLLKAQMCDLVATNKKLFRKFGLFCNKNVHQSLNLQHTFLSFKYQVNVNYRATTCLTVRVGKYIVVEITSNAVSLLPYVMTCHVLLTFVDYRFSYRCVPSGSQWRRWQVIDTLL